MERVRRLASHNRLLLTLAFVIIVQLVPTAHGVTCQILAMSVNSPRTIITGQRFEVDTILKITCTMTTDNVLARVDVSAQESTQILASNSQGLGSVDAGSKTWNVTIPSNAQAPASAGTWKLLVRAWVFVGVQVHAASNQTVNLQVSEPAETISTTAQSSSTSQSTTSSTSPSLTLSTLITTIVFALGVTAAALIFRKKRSKLETPPRTIEEPEMTKEKSRSTVPTGYPQLDAALGGGLPIGYAIIVTSAPFDERDLLLARMVESYISSRYSVFFVSRDLSRTRDLASRFKESFYAFNPRADKILEQHENIFKIQGVQNLNDVNISLGKAMESIVGKSPKKILVMDILSDVLLEHKALTTRKWLDDFLAKRKAESFTVLGTLNPLIVSDQERQTIIDLFDGVIEIYEKGYPERPRRYVIVKKMYGFKYKDMAIELERDRLF